MRLFCNHLLESRLFYLIILASVCVCVCLCVCVCVCVSVCPSRFSCTRDSSSQEIAITLKFYRSIVFAMLIVKTY